MTAEAKIKTSNKNIIDVTKDAITIVGGVTAILIGLFWVLGRQFRDGYYSSLNIPSYQLIFDVWDYGEITWIPVFAFLFFSVLLVRLINISEGNKYVSVYYKSLNNTGKILF